MSRIIYHPAVPEEPSYIIEVASVVDEGGGGDGGGEELSVAALLPAADIAGGEKGAKKCASCHSFDDGGANKIGPNLYGVVGRDIGGVAGFAYSEALAGHGGVWDFDALDAFLAKPKDFAPGTKMAYAGMRSAEDRADLILYLRSLAADPLPLPEADEAASDTALEAEGGESEGETELAAAADEATEAAEETVAAAVEQTEGVVEATEDAAGEVAAAAADVVEDAEETAATAAEVATDAASSAADATAEAASEASNAATDVVEGAVEQASDATEAVSDTAGEVAEAAAGAASTAVAAVSGAASDAADAAGGAVDAAASGLVAMIADGDVAKGEKVAKKCKACHVFDEGGKNKLGPALWGVVGRDVASHDGFSYSAALSGLEGDWSYDKLDQFLAGPKSYLPGTKMTFAGLKKDQDRVDLIAYLRTLSADPAPLN